MEKKNQPVVLFAVLNWGLGHASRSVPVIKFLQGRGYKIIICTDGQIIDFLEKECSDLVFEYLPGYNIKYTSRSMVYNMMSQLPKIYSTFSKENRKFRSLVKKYNPDFCISDNRYGCFSKAKPSFFIGHQWNIINKSYRINPAASKLNQYFIKRFDAILIPDDPSINLSGKLTTNITQIPFYYLGILSRFSALRVNHEDKDIDALAILSGPEPARTNFEKQILRYFGPRPKKQLAIIRGTKKAVKNEISSEVLSYDLVNSIMLEKLIQRSEFIISRSGYSSIMDYISLGVQNVLLVPTPGQTEQLYLAKQMKEYKGYDSCLQNKLGDYMKNKKSGMEIPDPTQYIHKIIANNNMLSDTWDKLKVDFHL